MKTYQATELPAILEEVRGQGQGKTKSFEEYGPGLDATATGAMLTTILEQFK